MLPADGGRTMSGFVHWAFVGAMGVFSLYHLNAAYDHFSERGTRTAAREVMAGYRADGDATRAMIAAAVPRCTWGASHDRVHPALRDFVVGVTLDGIAAGARGMDADASAIAEERTVALVRAMAPLDDAALAAIGRDSDAMERRADESMRCTFKTVAAALRRRA